MAESFSGLFIFGNLFDVFGGMLGMKPNWFHGNVFKDTEVSATNDQRDNPGKNSVT